MDSGHTVSDNGILTQSLQHQPTASVAISPTVSLGQ